MKHLRLLTKYGLLLLLVAIPVNFLLWAGLLDDGRWWERMLSSAVYFVLFSTLLAFAVRSRAPSRNGYIILLMLMAPCLCLQEITDWVNPPHGGTYTLGRKLEISGWLGSLADLCHYVYKKAVSVNAGSYSKMITPQTYSLLLGIGLTVILLRFNRSGTGLYRNAGHWMLAGAAFVGGYLLTDSLAAGNLSGNFLLAYLPAYGLLLVAYAVLRKRAPAKRRIPLVLAILLVFPTVSILPGTYNMITADTVPHYTGAVGVAPLAAALPFTLTQLVIDISPEGQLWPFSMKLYTLLQACIVFLALPSVLIPKTEKNG